MDQFLAPETDTKHQFLGPETDILCQFLVPETDIMGERNFMEDSFVLGSNGAHNYDTMGRSIDSGYTPPGSRRVKNQLLNITSMYAFF